MPMRISKDRINLDDKELQQAVLKDYGETVVTAESGSTYTIDLTAGNVFNITLTANCSFTFSNPPASGTAGSFTLFLTQDATGSRTATWPAAVKWPAATEPTLTTTASYLDVITFLTINEGASWFGAASAQDINPSLYPYYLDYGYFAGGSAPGAHSTNDRLDYASDTTTMVTKGPLSVARYSPAATGTSSYGYFGGGWAPGTRSTNDRLDYASDTTTMVTKGALSSARYYLAATGNSSYGYFAGGYGGGFRSTNDRLDYASDTTTMVTKGPLSVARYGMGGTNHHPV